jgi:hypothetical protein
MFWLASYFSKIKKPNSHFLENQRGIAGVRIFDTVYTILYFYHSNILI